MHCPASQSDADGYWVGHFGKLTRVSWTICWEEADSAQLHLTEDILLKKQFEDNVASVHGSIELSRAEFVQAAGHLFLPAFFRHAGGGGRSWSATVGGQGDNWTNKVTAPQGDVHTYICNAAGSVYFQLSILLLLEQSHPKAPDHEIKLSL